MSKSRIAPPVFLEWILSVVLKWTGIIWPRELFIRDSLLILIFHRIHPTRVDDRMTLSAPVFEHKIFYLTKHYWLLSLDVTQPTLTQRPAPPRHAVAVTFEDGCPSNYTPAVPILTPRGVPATFFLAVGAIDGEIRMIGLLPSCITAPKLHSSRSAKNRVRLIGTTTVSLFYLDALVQIGSAGDAVTMWQLTIAARSHGWDSFEPADLQHGAILSRSVRSDPTT